MSDASPARSVAGLEAPHAWFPRGFYYGPRPPEDFAPSDFGGLFHDLVGRQSHAIVGEAEVAVLGTAFDVTEAAEGEAAGRLARALSRSWEAFLDALDHQAGRHVVFFRSPDRAGVLGDATGCRTTFYDDDAIASHTRLLSDQPADDMPFARGFPGNWTPVPGVRILTPNTWMDLSTRKVSRFWPRTPPATLTLDRAQDLVETYSASALRQGPPLALGLTAGIDSRTVAVAAFKAGVDPKTFTYHRGAATQTDLDVARRIADRLGFPHATVTPRKPTEAMRERLGRATWHAHHINIVEPMAEALDGRAVVSGHLLEIGRSFYGAHRRHGRDLSTAEQLAGHYHDNLRKSLRDGIDAYGRERWMATAVEAFDDFNRTSDFQTGARLIDPFDLFYWEHRMGTWQSLILLERDFYAEPYMPFNCRAIFAAMLGVPRSLREEAALFRRLTDVPELAGIPITSSSTAAVSWGASPPASVTATDDSPDTPAPPAARRSWLKRVVRRIGRT